MTRPVHDWQPLERDGSRLSPSRRFRRCARCGVVRRLKGEDRIYAFYAATGHFIGHRPPACAQESSNG